MCKSMQFDCFYIPMGFPGGSDKKESASNAGDLSSIPGPGRSSLGLEDPLEKGMATDSSIFAWRIPWTEEPSSRKELDTTETDSFTFTLL